MKESVGGISLFSIVIVFILLFTMYICFSLNYSKAYSVKNELLTIIKNQGGVCTSADASSNPNCQNFTEFVSTLLKEANYHVTGDCSRGDSSDGWVGFDRQGKETDSDNASFCILGVSASGNSELSDAVYYRVKVFYQIDIPIFSQVFNLSVSGETGRIYSPNECVANRNYCWCNKPHTCTYGEVGG